MTAEIRTAPPEVSEARRQASRENGRKGRGPTSEDGKNRSRENSLIHGLAAKVVLPSREIEAVARRADAWRRTFRPADDYEDWLVQRAAWASVQLDRDARLGLALRDKAAVAAQRRW